MKSRGGVATDAFTFRDQLQTVPSDHIIFFKELPTSRGFVLCVSLLDPVFVFTSIRIPSFMIISLNTFSLFLGTLYTVIVSSPLCVSFIIGLRGAIYLEALEVKGCKLNLI